MRNILILVVLIFVICFETNAHQAISDRIEEQLLSIANTFCNEYSECTISLVYGESLDFIIHDENRVFKIIIPGRDNLEIIAKLVQSTNELSNTNNYYKRILAHQINLFLINELTLENEGTDQSIISKLIEDIVISDIRYCVRYTDTYIFDKLRKKHYTPEILKEMKGLLYQPLKTKEEAHIIISSTKPMYSILDTIGYKSKTEEYQNILKEYKLYESKLKKYNKKAKSEDMSLEKWLNTFDTSGFKTNLERCLERKSDLQTYTGKVNSWIRNAEKSKMMLEPWLDSMQSLHDTLFVANYVKGTLNLLSMFQAIGRNYLTELAPDIEQLLIARKFSEEDIQEAYLQLARMQYNGYDNKIIESIEIAMKETNSLDYILLNKHFKKLVYINTQASFYATAPLLLNKKDYNDMISTAPINARFFVQLKGYIHNFPWNEEEEVKDLEKKGIYIYSFNDPWDVNKYLPEGFLNQIYQWMLDNNGNYDIVQE